MELPPHPDIGLPGSTPSRLLLKDDPARIRRVVLLCGSTPQSDWFAEFCRTDPAWLRITNGAAEPQRAKVVRFALEHRFDHVQIEGEHGFGKPEERAYNHAMDVLGVRPDETWMVGDNLEWENRGTPTARHLRDLARPLRLRATPKFPDPP